MRTFNKSYQKIINEYYEVEDDDYNPLLNAAARSIIGDTVTWRGRTGKVVDVDAQTGYALIKTDDGETVKAEIGEIGEDAEKIPPYDPDLDTSDAYEGIQSQYLSSDPGDADPDLVAYVKKEVKDIVDESGLSVEEALKIVKEELPDVIQAIGVDEFTGEFNLDIEDNEVHLKGTGWAAEPPPVDEEVRLGNTWNDRFKRLNP